MAAGDRINASDYNGVQTTINTVLGTYYGQTVNSAQIPTPSPSSITKITASQWQNLYKDILTCYDHQNASAGSLTWPTTSTKIYSDDFNAYRTMANGCSTNYKNFNSSYYTTTTLAQPTISGGWGINPGSETVSHATTCTWTNTTQAGNFFNLGGEIRFTASISGGSSGTAGTKDYSWASMVSHMGTVRLGGNGTTQTTNSTLGQTVDVLRTDIGYSQLTTSDVLIFQMTSSSYNPNMIQIYARVSGAQLIVTVQYEDRSANPNPGWGTDELVTAQLNSYVTGYAALGGPSFNPPTYPTDLKIVTSYMPSATDSGFVSQSGPG
jgi:hypothetical protein